MRFLKNSEFDKITSNIPMSFVNNNWRLLYKLYCYLKENGGYIEGKIIL